MISRMFRAALFRALPQSSRALCLTASLLVCGVSLAADPPSRVARLNYTAGTVTFAPAGSDDWAYAPLNRPLTTGDRLWTDKDGRAELHVGSTALRLASNTSLDIQTLSDDATRLQLNQGTFSLRQLRRDSDQQTEIATPNLVLSPSTVGEYRLDVDPDRDTTTVTVDAGRAVVSGQDGSQQEVEAGQQIRFAGQQLQQQSASDNPPRDSFDRWIAERDRREDNSVSARYVGREVTGYDTLDDYGRWDDDPGLGPVWVPHITIVDWAPYRYGHWAWVAPWGWTWVDDAPWGFAPFHYGRWARWHDRWAWVPGQVVSHPVYAPALVAFVGGRSGNVSWSISLSSGSPGVAWVPLAPGEPYQPAYRTSPTYVTNINKTVYVTRNVTQNITINKTVNKTVYVNQQVNNAVTAVPADAFVKGRAVETVAQPVSRERLAQARPVAAPALTPVKQSLLGAARPAGLRPPPITNRPLLTGPAPTNPQPKPGDPTRPTDRLAGGVPVNPAPRNGEVSQPAERAAPQPRSMLNALPATGAGVPAKPAANKPPVVIPRPPLPAGMAAPKPVPAPAQPVAPQPTVQHDAKPAWQTAPKSSVPHPPEPAGKPAWVPIKPPATAVKAAPAEEQTAQPKPAAKAVPVVPAPRTDMPAPRPESLKPKPDARPVIVEKPPVTEAPKPEPPKHVEPVRPPQPAPGQQAQPNREAQPAPHPAEPQQQRPQDQQQEHKKLPPKKPWLIPPQQ